MCTDKQARDFFNSITPATVAKIPTAKIQSGWDRTFVQRFAPKAIRLAWMAEIENRGLLFCSIPADATGCHWCGGDTGGLEVATLHLDGGYHKKVLYECSTCKRHRFNPYRAPKAWQAAHRRLLEI